MSDDITDIKWIRPWLVSWRDGKYFVYCYMCDYARRSKSPQYINGRIKKHTRCGFHGVDAGELRLLTPFKKKRDDLTYA